MHTGEYLPFIKLHKTSQAVDRSKRDSLSSSHGIPLEVIQPDDDPVQSGLRLELFPFHVCRVKPNLFIHVERNPHRAGSQAVGESLSRTCAISMTGNAVAPAFAQPLDQRLRDLASVIFRFPPPPDVKLQFIPAYATTHPNQYTSVPPSLPCQREQLHTKGKGRFITQSPNINTASLCEGVTR